MGVDRELAYGRQQQMLAEAGLARGQCGWLTLATTTLDEAGES